MSNQIKCDQNYSTDLTIHENFMLGCPALRRLRQVRHECCQAGYGVKPCLKTTKQEEAAPPHNQPLRSLTLPFSNPPSEGGGEMQGKI